MGTSTAPALYYLVLVSEDPPKTYALTQDYVHIGRSRQNEIVVDNPHVSRVHARIIRQKEVFILEDLNSTNGTFVNERRVMHPVVLQVGDRIRLGPEVVFQFVGPETDLEPTRVVPVVGTQAPQETGRERPMEERPLPVASAPVPTRTGPVVPPPPAHSPTPSGAETRDDSLPSPTLQPHVATPASGPARSGSPSPEAEPTMPRLSPTEREIVYTPRRRFPAWLWGLLALSVFACGMCMGWLWWVDATNQWCAYTLFRMLLPGCP